MSRRCLLRWIRREASRERPLAAIGSYVTFRRFATAGFLRMFDTRISPLTFLPSFLPSFFLPSFHDPSGLFRFSCSAHGFTWKEVRYKCVKGGASGCAWAQWKGRVHTVLVLLDRATSRHARGDNVSSSSFSFLSLSLSLSKGI